SRGFGAPRMREGGAAVNGRGSSGVGMKPNIELHIEELVLYGFALGDRERIQAAVEQELTRLFAEEGIPSELTRGGEILYPDEGTFTVAAHSRAEAVGVQVASAVYRSLSR